MTEEVGTGCHLADLSVADWWRCLAIAAYREEHPAVIGQMQVLCFDRTVDPLAARPLARDPERAWPSRRWGRSWPRLLAARWVDHEPGPDSGAAAVEAVAGRDRDRNAHAATLQ